MLPHRHARSPRSLALGGVFAASLVFAVVAGILSCDQGGGDEVCKDDLDCAADERCTSTGICVPGAGECASTEECPSLGAADRCGDVVVWCIGGECRYAGDCLRLGGRVEGLVGRGLVLANGAEFLPVDTNDVFQFDASFGHDDPFAVVVATHPLEPAQICSVDDGDGVFEFSDVATVRIVCTFRSEDADGDSVCDGPNLADGCIGVNDNCLAVANKSQRDADEDGLGDACDQCTDGDSDGWGRPELDQSGCTHAGDDCNDASAEAHPDRLERCDDGIDNDCDDDTDEEDCQRAYAPPVAHNDLVELTEDADASVIDALGNDEVWDDPKANLTIVSVTEPNNGGTAGVEQQGRRLRYRPRADFAGQESFAYTVQDGVGGTATGFVIVTVTPVNDVPIANPDIYSVPEDAAPSVFDVMGNDTTAPDQGEVLQVLAIGATSGGGVARLLLGSSVEYTPARDFAGQETFSYILSDGSGGADAIGSVTVRVLAVNDSPAVARAINDTVATEDAPWNWALPIGTFTDADGDPLAIAVTSVSDAALPPWLIYNASALTLTGVPRNEHVGDALLRVTATDPAGAVASDVFELTVINTNDPPQVTKVIHDQHVQAGDVWAFVPSADTFHDPDAGDALSFAATLAAGGDLPSWLDFEPSTGLFVGTPRYPDLGIIDVRLTATDGAGATAAEVFRVVVATDDQPPVVANPIGPQAAVIGVPWVLPVPADTFDDPDGDPLDVTATLSDGADLPDWLSFQGFTRIFSGTAAAGDAGDLEITVTAVDPIGAVATDTFVLTVVP